MPMLKTAAARKGIRSDTPNDVPDIREKRDIISEPEHSTFVRCDDLDYFFLLVRPAPLTTLNPID